MPDTKITALAAIGANPINVATFPIPMVDLTDTSMAASGTTKKVTVNQILGAGGTATLASATISGDLTVDTNVLKVDTTLNRVGIGTATPTRPLDIVGSFQSSSGWALVGSPPGLGGSVRYIGGAGGTDNWYFNALTGGNHLWAFGEVEAMRLNSTGLGVGVASPAYKLDVNGTANCNFLRVTSSSGTALSLVNTTSALTYSLYSANTASNGFNGFGIFNGTSYDLQIVNGNFGIAVAPSAWNNTYNVLDIGQNGSISGRTSTNNSVDIVSNGFRNSGGTWVYKLATSNAASRYLIDGATGGHLWYSGAAGTAGNTIAGFSTATMTLDASGRLILLASTTTPATLSTNGQLTFTATSDTNLRFSYRGSDGVTRVANITLA